MNFTDHFHSFLVSSPKISPDKPQDFFLGRKYEMNSSADTELITILSGGALEASFPYAYHFLPLPCYLLLYTENGYGKLFWDNNIYSLESNTLLFLRCDQKFRIEIAVSPWNYHVFFMTGAKLDFYYHLFPSDSFPLFFLPDYSPIIRNIYKLASGSPSSSIYNKLFDSRLINDILCDLLMENFKTESAEARTPDYLQEMKNLFDIDYQENYALDELEEHFNISKYRLCREFHTYFGESPKQYLNNRRIDIAKDLLLTTDYRIHEIGSLVGLENTNHFINLFKKRTGLTPLSYKKELLRF